MVSKKTASETNPIKLILWWCDCTDITVSLLQEHQAVVQFLDKLLIKLPITAEDKEMLYSIFVSDIDNFFSETTAKVLKEKVKIEDDAITMPLKVCMRTSILMSIIWKINTDEVKKIYAVVYNLCWYNLSKDADREVTALDIVLLLQMVMNEKIYLSVGADWNIILVNAQSVQYGLENDVLEWNVVNAFRWTEEFEIFLVWEFESVLSDFQKARIKIYEEGKLKQDLLIKQMERAMSIISNWTITINYSNSTPEYMTHKFKSEDMDEYKELQEYVENEWSWCWHIWRTTFKWRTVGFQWEKKIKLKEDKKRKK